VSETGSIKFTCQQVAVEISPFAGFAELNAYRRKLLELGMIGVDASGIGFGNLSIRNGATPRFYITGSATGGIFELMPTDYARVVAYEFERNWLQCEGSTVASSESLTHAAVYESEPTAGGVIHCHDMKLWAALLDEAPTTPKGVEYGTPEMAYAVRRLFSTTDVKSRKVFVMAAHEGGLVTFGRDLEEAFGVLMRSHALLEAGSRKLGDGRKQTQRSMKSSERGVEQ
jgi:L-ribulose-5-phosphate 4-epimerase